MTLRAFFRVRRQQRLQRRASSAMNRVFGAAWSENQAGIVSMLSSPSPVYVLDVEMLGQVVAEALASSAVAEEQAISTFPVEPVYEAEGPDGESFPVGPAAEVSAEPYVEERSNGVAAGPVDMSNDDRRRAFLPSSSARTTV